MSKMIKLHTRILFWMIFIIGAYLLLHWAIDTLFGITVPTQIMLIAIAGAMVMDVCKRVKFLHIQNLTDGDESMATQRRIVLIAIPAELLFTLLCLSSLFSN